MTWAVFKFIRLNFVASSMANPCCSCWDTATSQLVGSRVQIWLSLADRYARHLPPDSRSAVPPGSFAIHSHDRVKHLDSRFIQFFAELYLRLDRNILDFAIRGRLPFLGECADSMRAAAASCRECARHGLVTSRGLCSAWQSCCVADPRHDCLYWCVCVCMYKMQHSVQLREFFARK
jgi:hypothetical protein